MKFLLPLALLLFASHPVPAAEPGRLVGVAKVDITPDYPVRLSGYGSRREVHEGVAQKIFAKALAIGTDAEGPAVLVTVDNCGVSAATRAEVVRRLAAKTKVTGERFAIASSHTHCAPMLADVLPNIFSMDIPAEHWAAIERYTRELTDKIEQAALAALADRRPAQLAWSSGKVAFAANRRRGFASKVVDHELPVLRVTAADGKVRALFASYACHSTTLSFNFIHGDWGGCAQEALERDFPGAIAMTALGCGADQNPDPRGTVELAVQHGEALAAEAKRLATSEMRPVTGALECRTKEIQLAFDTLPTREEWAQLAQSKSANIAFHARKNLARLERGETLPTQLPYLVQTWAFGDDLAMVFLPGEVVVDYGLRLKRDFDGGRLWVNAYSNDVPCYIPSKRILEEGGYEGATAMVYYDRPTKFAPDVEERIVAAVRELLPKSFLEKKTASPAAALPKTGGEGMMSMHVKPGLEIELVASEPLVMDPVAIDWGTDGKLWVVEQPDYPAGMDGNWKPGGRVKFLTDTNGDGRYEKATLFLEGIPFPTGITAWRKGVLVCAAPDILYAEDTDGDGRADVVKKLYSGFFTDNYNARVNSLTLGLDGWLHGANGLLGGKIRSAITGQETDISGRDIRIQPETGALELVSGVSQQGRTRDDWDNWFGCSNGRLIFHFPMPERYVRRNPHVPAPPPSVTLPADPEPNRLNPVSASGPLDRFNHPESYGQTTSACGVGIYRDVLLGEEYYGNSFTCEAAHNLVRRLRLEERGATFAAYRPADERDTEFLASEDPWSRPVQVRTGPDGGLYVVDMVRAVIEHTRWIPADRMAQLDVRAGEKHGRIYRIVGRGAKLRPIRDLRKLAMPELVAALDTPNGTTRDLVHQLLLERHASAKAGQPEQRALYSLAEESAYPAVRLQALAILQNLDLFHYDTVKRHVKDPDPRVRRGVLRLAEPYLPNSRGGRLDGTVAAACLELVNDPDFAVRYQLALTVGDSSLSGMPSGIAVLGTLAKRDGANPWMRAAIVSSSSFSALEVLEAMLAAPSDAGRDQLAAKLVATAAAVLTEAKDLERLFHAVAGKPGEAPRGWQMIGAAQLDRALERRKLKLVSLPGADALKPIFTAAHHIARDLSASEEERAAAIRLLGRGFNDPGKDLEELAAFLAPGQLDALQKAALEQLLRTGDAAPALLLRDWPQHGPALRTRIVNALLNRDAWTGQLLDAVANGTVAADDLPMANRQALAKHANATIRERAAKLLATGIGSDRKAVLEKYRTVAELQGNAVKGGELFTNVCSSCHSYIGRGSAVGPDLKAFYNKSPQDFLVAILDPNAAIEPRFAGYVVECRDGRSLLGVIASESATSVALAQPGGAREEILRTDIRAIRGVGQSLMPEGLEQSLPPQAIADVIAFLKSGG
jgi:putative membrane-bound dehydrogenase-like protein